MKTFRFFDLFCGAGGATTGMIQALNNANIKYEGRVYNHWDIAIETQRLNHPEVVDRDGLDSCNDIKNVLPDRMFLDESREIDVGWASPSCTHFSVAASGVPKSEQLREQPEMLLPFMRLTRTKKFFIENVKQLLSWGPLLDKDTCYKGKLYKVGQPDPRKKSLFFNDWYRSIKCSGYQMEWAILNAADYGANTNRERLIIQCIRKSSGLPITWPEPTHARTPGLFHELPWRPASEIIDWSDPGRSIYDRETPLKENTLRRIECGIRKFWGELTEPFIVVLRGTTQNCINASAVPITVPLQTITTTGAHFGLVRPFFTRYNGGDNRVHDPANPLPVIDCGNRYGLVTPLFIPQHGDGTVKPVSMPLSTIATTGSIALVTPLMVEYYGNGRVLPISEPVPVIPTKDRFGLLQGRILTLPDGSAYKLDILYRMLKASELATASSFPDDFQFAGKDAEIKKQIGNAVPPVLAKALMLEHLKRVA